MEAIKKTISQGEKNKKLDRNIIKLEKPHNKFRHSAFHAQLYISPNRLELLCGESSFVASM